ncbi:MULTISPECIES: oxidoreductase-like domain-containing protein [Cupriavidus]|uniref:oxidoreductase-like domain-containing protein n=1 Tax=Cupriavidus TaxID=106589 RepID=UPI00352DA8F9
MSQVSPVNPVANPADDPRPVPPERPGDDECCGSGCDPCIFDFYYQELDRYREELRAWEARHAARHAEDPAS